jgi:general stress protein 26
MVSITLELNYNDEIKEIIAFMEKNRNITLATSLDNRVTARTVQYINDGLDVYFTSFEFNKKIQQINGNPNVALNLNHIQIEGKAEVFSSSLPDELKSVEDRFAAKYKWFTRISESNTFVFVKISPKKLVIFKSIDGIFHLKNFDLENKKVYQMKLADKDAPNYPY